MARHIPAQKKTASKKRPTARGKPENLGRVYRDGELELILSLVPTRTNVERLASSLGRSADAIEIVYRLAYHPDHRFGSKAEAQRRKVLVAREVLGLLDFAKKEGRAQPG